MINILLLLLLNGSLTFPPLKSLKCTIIVGFTVRVPASGMQFWLAGCGDHMGHFLANRNASCRRAQLDSGSTRLFFQVVFLIVRQVFRNQKLKSFFYIRNTLQVKMSAVSESTHISSLGKADSLRQQGEKTIKFTSLCQLQRWLFDKMEELWCKTLFIYLLLWFYSVKVGVLCCYLFPFCHYVWPLIIT